MDTSFVTIKIIRSTKTTYSVTIREIADVWLGVPLLMLPEEEI
jgi:hypothetical protein